MHQCPECGEIAAEPRLRYCEQCGARMPEYKPPTLEAAEGMAAAGAVAARPPKPAYTGPKWLAYVPAHSPTVLGVMLHMLALGLSILPFLAGVGPFWSFVLFVGGLLVVAREYRHSNERQPLVEWIPERFHPSFVPALYVALAVALTLPMLQLSVQPALWLGGTALVLWDQWGKVFAGPEGYARLFDARELVRVPRVVASAGIAVCLMSLFFTWAIEGEFNHQRATPTPGKLRTIDVPRPTHDVLYGGEEVLRKSGLDLPVASTVELGLMGLLMLLMLKRDAERPVWLRLVPAGVVVISIAWVLANLRLKAGPVMFLAGLVPVTLIAVLQALGHEELPALSPASREPPPLEEPPVPEDPEAAMRDDFPTEEGAPPYQDEKPRG